MRATSWGRSERHASRWTRGVLVASLVLLMAVPAAAVGSGGIAGASSNERPSAAAATALAPTVRPSSLGGRQPTSTVDCLSDADPCYLQEGAQPNDFNNYPAPGDIVLTSLTENFTVVNNGNDVRPSGGTLRTSYELNGVTSLDDWVQMSVGDNWYYSGYPCSIPTYTLTYQIWNDVGVSEDHGRVGTNLFGCDQPYVPAVGDVMSLSMTLDCAGEPVGEDVCLTYDDVTQQQVATAEFSLPDYVPSVGQADGFVTTLPFNGANGYFIGPTTESTWAGGRQPTGCPTIVLPTVNYTFSATGYSLSSSDPLDGPLYVSNYDVWSAEFNQTGSGANNLICYQAGLPAWDPSDDRAWDFGLSSSPLTQFQDASFGSPVGPHIVSGQNWTATESMLGVNDPGVTRFQTDPPIPAPTLTFLSGDGYLQGIAAVESGQAYVAYTTAGSYPFGCFWTIDGTWFTPSPAGSCDWTGGALSTGIFEFTSYDVSANGEVVSSSGELWVLPSLTGYLRLEPNSDIAPLEQDVGVLYVQTFASGGDGPYVYFWNGFPSAWGCQYAAPSFDCIPTTAGTFSVSVTILDALGVEYTSSPLTVRVYDPCASGDCEQVVFRGNAPAGVAWGASLGVVCVPCHFVEALTPTNASVPPVYDYLVPDGTYEYVLTGPSNESVLVAPVGNLTVNGTNLTEPVGFGKAVRAPVSVSVVGLPKGEALCLWLVELRCLGAGAQGRSVGNDPRFAISGLSPGTYPYTIEPSPGFETSVSIGGAAANFSGWLTVTSHGAHVAVSLRPSVYALTFQETGLPAGKPWTVQLVETVNGKAKTIHRTSKTDAITFELTNGSYVWSVRPVKGYDSVAASDVTIRGVGTNVSVPFVVHPPAKHAGAEPAALGLAGAVGSPRPAAGRWEARASWLTTAVAAVLGSGLTARAYGPFRPRR